MNTKTNTLNPLGVLRRAAFAAFFTAFSIILPQIFHALGNAMGISALGAAILPMHLPVILSGFFCGPATGFIVGIASCIISHMISAMPTAALLPFIAIELAFYGLCAGLLTKKSSFSFAKLLAVQISGRAARAVAVLFAFYVLGISGIGPATIIEFIKTGIFGIILQWIVISAIMKYFDKDKYNEA